MDGDQVMAHSLVHKSLILYRLQTVRALKMMTPTASVFVKQLSHAPRARHWLSRRLPSVLLRVTKISACSQRRWLLVRVTRPRCISMTVRAMRCVRRVWLLNHSLIQPSVVSNTLKSHNVRSPRHTSSHSTQHHTYSLQE